MPVRAGDLVALRLPTLPQEPPLREGELRWGGSVAGIPIGGVYLSVNVLRCCAH